MATQIRVIAQDDDRVVYLDVSEEQPLTANFQFKDIQSIDKNKGNHTYNFRLPSTPNNDLFFNQYFEVTQQGNFNPKLKAEATITKNTIDVFNGYLQLTNVICSDDVTYHYECVVFSSVSTLGQVLEGKYMQDHDWTTYNHTINFTNVTESMNRDVTPLKSGDIVYSLYDYGSQIYGGSSEGSIEDEETPISVTNLRPQIRLNKVVSKILQEAGFTYESTFLDTTLNDVYIDMNAGGDGVVTASNPDFYKVRVYADGTQTFTATNGFHTIINSDTTNENYTNESSEYNETTGVYSPSDAWSMMNWSVNCQMTATGTSLVGTTYQVVLYDVTDDVVIGATPIKIMENSSGNIDESGLVGNPVQAINVLNTFEARVLILSTTDATATITIDGGFVRFFPQMYALSGAVIDYNATLTFQTARNFPNIKSIDFLKSVAKKFNLVILPDTEQPTHLYITPYKDWIEQGNEVDWTSKLDTSKDVQLKPTTDLQAKSIMFTDEKSDDFINSMFLQSSGKIYGSQFVDNTSTDFGKDKEEIKTIFVPTITSYIPNTGVRSCVCYNEGSASAGIRLSFYCGYGPGDNGSDNAWIIGQGSSAVQFTSFPIFQNYEDAVVTPTTKCLTFAGESTGALGFPIPLNGAFSVYWKRFIEETYSRDARILTGTFFLSALDIMSMNFNDLILVKNTWFRLNNISNYPLTGSGSCSVELVKVERVNMIDDALVSCTSEPEYSLATGEVIFTNTDTGVVEATTQGCCEAFGYVYESSKCWNQNLNPNNPTEPPSEYESSEFVLGGNNQSNGVFNNILGNNNVASEFTSIKGVNNVVHTTSPNNDVSGNKNTINENVNSSIINGNYNSLKPYSLNFDGTQVKVFSRQTFKSNSITGDYGITLGNGDTFISGGADSIYNEVGRSGSGHFVKHCWTTAEEQINIGQYGEFTIGTGGNTPFINQANNLFRLQYPSMISFEINVVGHDRGSVATRNQAYSFRKYSGVINNTNNSANVSILNVTADSVKETSEFTSYAFAILPGNGSFQPVTGGNEYLNDGMFYFSIDTNGADKLINVDWTIDFRYTLVGLQNITRTPGTIIFSPTDISGCLLWVDAADVSTITESSGDVSQWDDKSGNNHHLTQSTASYQPTYSLSNFDPYIEFDGLNKVLGNTDANLINVSDSTNTMFIVFKSDNTTTSSSGQALASVNYRGRQYYGMNINSTTAGAGGTAFMNKSAQDYSCNNSTIASTTKQVVIGTRDGTDRIIYDQNGNTDTKTNSTDTSQDMFSVGAAWETGRTPTADFRGKIYEIIVYDSVLSDTKRNQVLNYLQTKWNT